MRRAADARLSEALLQSKGLRRTKPREAILDVLVRHPGAMSHKELCAALASRALDQATVYRNLIALTEAGVLVRRQLGDGLWRFALPPERGDDHTEHPHLVCDGCGRLHCLPRESVSLHGEAASHRVLEIVLRGLCERCLSAGAVESDATRMRE